MLCTLSRMDHRSRNRLLWTTVSTPIVSKSRLSPTITRLAITTPLNIFRLLPLSMFNTSTTRTLHLAHPQFNTHLFRLAILSRIFLTRRHTHTMPIPILPLASRLRRLRPARDLRMHPCLGPTHLPILTRMKSRKRMGIILQKPVSNPFLMRRASLLGTTTRMASS
jgi:hypothetical protein